ncbi:MAG: DNA polymerase [Bacteroidales bacterium]|nr:DNA polymerase [Bacteroidales bacterium]
MVTSNYLFFIDSTFILKSTYETFLGCPLLTFDGKNNTFLYGFLRNLLRLRTRLGINKLLVAFGKESYVVATESDVLSVIEFLVNIDISYLNKPLLSSLELAVTLKSQVDYFLTDDEIFFQLASENQFIILAGTGQKFQCLSSKDIEQRIGVPQKYINTYLSLTSISKTMTLTKRQIIRLIEKHGDIQNIYRNIDWISPAGVRKMLRKNKKFILSNFDNSNISKFIQLRLPTIQDHTLELDMLHKEKLMHDHGFHSLVRLLKKPTAVKLECGIEKKSETYKAVTNRRSLDDLITEILNSTICAIDTESDDKDPHIATLLGVSFSLKKDEAFFVPLLSSDLQNINGKDVRQALKRIFAAGTHFVGHNIKYDYMMLRRIGIEIPVIHFDTMLAAFECYGDMEFLNLAHLAKIFLSKHIKSYKEVVKKGQTFLELPLKEMVKHGCQDADITLQLYHFLKVELQNRGILDQFEKNVLPEIKLLGEMEYQGVKVKSPKLLQLREDLISKIIKLRELIYAIFGKKFDLNSQKELAALLKENHDLKTLIGSQSITISLLRSLSTSYPVIQNIIKYKQYSKDLRALDLISKAVKKNRVYPTFNQTRTKYGQLCSKNPNLFELEIVNINCCFDDILKPYFRDRNRIFSILGRISGDKKLIDDYLKGWVSLVKLRPLLQRIDVEELILSVVIGESDFKLTQKFMINRVDLSMLHHDIEKRYTRLFEWKGIFCKETLMQGYAVLNDQKKYLSGLSSSNLEKKKNALILAIKWAIQY